VKISDILSRDAVIAELHGRDVQSVLGELCGPIAYTSRLPIGDFVEALASREALSPTGIGEGVGVPHGRHPRLRRLAASFGRSRAGIDFGASDGQPVHLFFALFSPPDPGGADLNALARMSLLLSNPALRDALREAPGAGEIYRLLIEEEKRVSLVG
jgi:nitrogen PTS system EIIA component